MKGRFLIIVTAMAAWTLAPANLSAQGRHGVAITDPGVMHVIGQSGASYGFGQYSYGLGSVQASRSTPTDVLRSSISDLGPISSSNRTVTPGDSGLSQLIAPPTGSTFRKFGAGVSDISEAQRGSAMAALMKSTDMGKLDSVSSYMFAIGAGSKEDYLNKTEAITTLVPSQPGLYRDYLQQAETNFRSGQFSLAIGQYQLANDLGSTDWISLLGMAQTEFARNNFRSSCVYLEQVIKYFPELPLLTLEPRGFFGDRSRYADNLARLEREVQDDPRDAEKAFLLAYFRWFDQNAAASQKALSRCLASAQEKHDEDLLDAIGTFWRGMVQSGKVKGELQPEARPTPSPAGPKGKDVPASAPATAPAGKAAGVSSGLAK